MGRTLGWSEADKTTPADVAVLSNAEEVVCTLMTERDWWTHPQRDELSVQARLQSRWVQVTSLNTRNASLAEIDDALAFYRRVLRHEVSRAYVELDNRRRGQQADELAAWYGQREHLGEEFASSVLELTREQAIAD